MVAGGMAMGIVRIRARVSSRSAPPALNSTTLPPYIPPYLPRYLPRYLPPYHPIAIAIFTFQSSVPMVFIGGKYVGGYSDGPTDEAPVLVPLSFDGKLRPMLEEAGAL